MNSSKFRSERVSTRPHDEAGIDPDDALIGAIAAGNQGALEEIHARYSRRIRAFALKLTGRHDLAEEVACETLTVIWLSAARFRNAAKVSTWIFGIAYILSMQALRNIHTAVAKVANSQIEAFYDPRSSTEIREWLDAALALLPEDQRTALELSYRFGHTCQQIADTVGCPRNTVKTRMFHGRRKLRELLPKLAVGRDSAV